MGSRSKYKYVYKVLKKLGKGVVLVIAVVVALLLLALILLFWDDIMKIVEPIISSIWPDLRDLGKDIAKDAIKSNIE